MPVWHAATEELRRENALVVIGITQEQHPERCRLFAQWQGLDWPVLWDPLNLTNASAVPGVFAIDEFGIIRKARMDPRRVEQELVGEFLAAEFEAPASAPSSAQAGPRVGRGWLTGEYEGAAPEAEYSRLLWGTADERDGILERLEGFGLDPEQAEPAALFRAGVAYRMRHDSPEARPTDFQRALDLWAAALARDPNQYIWRRRIQQYGPRLDKPYPFYDWVERAQAEIRARSQEPVELGAPLSGAELAQPSNQLPSLAESHEAPDPERRIALDDGRLIRIEAAAAVHTASAGARVRQRPSARVHLALRPDVPRDVHWTNDAGATQVWITVPRGWRVERHLYELARPTADVSSEVRRLDFELSPPEDWHGAAEVRGYALYFVCAGTSGECLYRRQDFVVPVLVE